MKKVVLWGHKLHSHTHSYIHYGFQKAFESMGIEVLWLDNDDDICDIDFNNVLFITEGHVDAKIPIIDTAYYVLHNVNYDKYNNLNKKNIMMLQVYTNSCLQYNPKIYPHRKNTYYDDDCLFTMWATDLLPGEIQKNIIDLEKIDDMKKNKSYFIGMPFDTWDKFKNWCKNNNIVYQNYGGFGNNISALNNKKLIQESIIAPALQSQWQIDNEYIPCRIFKNISYGKMGITNSKAVNELFGNKLIYDENIDKLCDEALVIVNDKNHLNLVKELMEDVCENHTYLNLINSIFWFFKEVRKNDIMPKKQY